MTDIRELSINELDAVSGGMDCKTGMAVADTYMLAGEILSALGDHVGAGTMFGRGRGVLEGSCGV